VNDVLAKMLSNFVKVGSAALEQLTYSNTSVKDCVLYLLRNANNICTGMSSATPLSQSASAFDESARRKMLVGQWLFGRTLL